VVERFREVLGELSASRCELPLAWALTRVTSLGADFGRMPVLAARLLAAPASSLLTHPCHCSLLFVRSTRLQLLAVATSFGV